MDIDLPFEDESLEEGQITKVDLGGRVKTCTIWVYSGEGPIPHFHVKNERFESCIHIFESKYANHEDYHKTLNDDQVKILDSKLREKATDNKTYWDQIVDLWYQNNPENASRYKDTARYLKCKTQPNYADLNGPIITLKTKDDEKKSKSSSTKNKSNKKK